MTSLPAAGPAEAVCNLGRLPAGVRPADLKLRRSEEDSLEQRISDELGSNVLVTTPTEEQR